MESYLEKTSIAGESNKAYAKRLEAEGHCEIFIRKALRYHFSMEIQQFGEFFEEFEAARLRHIAQVANLRTYPYEKSFVRKVSQNLGISEDRAENWVRRFKASEFAG